LGFVDGENMGDTELAGADNEVVDPVPQSDQRTS
jgi:hypothetical protein